MPVEDTALAERFTDLVGSARVPFEEVDSSTLDFHRLPQRVPITRYEGRIVAVGPVTRASIPGDCLGTALGIEDAWVLADSLAYGPSSLDAALEGYAARRRDREEAITAKLDQFERSGSDCGPQSPALRRLHLARGLAFSHLVDGSVPAIATAVPECL